MGRNWLQKKNIFFGDPDFFSSSITSVRIVGDCRPFQKHIGQAISTTFRFDKVNWGYVPISFRRLKTAKNGRKRLKTAENVTSWDDLRPILDINFDNTGDENRLKSPKIASFSFWIVVKFLGGSGDENRLKSPKIASFSFWIVVKFLGGSGVIEIDVQNGT